MLHATRALGRICRDVPGHGVEGVEGAPALMATQDRALSEMRRMADSTIGPWGPRGYLGFVGCGHGKTLICQLAPEVFDAKRPMLIVPHANYQATLKAILEWSVWFPTRPIKVITYESLSSLSGSTQIERHGPDLLICDEAHLLSDPKSGRWRRFAKFVQANPSTRCVFVSGTLIGRSLYSWAHLAHAALRDMSPLPSNRAELSAWAAVLDHNSDASATDWAALAPLGPFYDADDARDKFHAMLSKSPGVTFSHGVSADTSLYLRECHGVPYPDAMIKAQTDVECAWVLPNGTELVDTLEFIRHERSLRYGYFSTWAPRPVNPKQAAEYDAFFVARRTWGRLLRRGMEEGIGDTPAEVESAVNAGAYRVAERAWKDWKFLRQREPPRQLHWLEGAMDWIAATVKFEAANVEGDGELIVWYGSRPISDVLRSIGYPVHGISSQAPVKGDAACSYFVHGKGWNGQHYSRQLVLEGPLSSKTWEQMLSRMHRHGQTRDVWASVLLPTLGSQIEMKKIKATARHNAHMSGEQQRILYGTWL